MIPKIAWLQGWLFKYVLWKNENWEIDSFKKQKNKKKSTIDRKWSNGVIIIVFATSAVSYRWRLFNFMMELAR